MSRNYLYLGVAEAIIFFVAAQLGALFRFGSPLPTEMSTEGFLATGAVFSAAMTAAMTAMGLYQRGAQEQEAAFVVRLGIAFILGPALLAVAYYAIPSLYTGRGVLGMSLVFSFVGISVAREIFARLATAESRKRRVLVIGAGANAKAIADLVSRDRSLSFIVAGYVPLCDGTPFAAANLCRDMRRSLVEQAIAESIDEIVIAADDRRGKLPIAELIDCRLSGFEVLDLQTFFEKELQILRIDLIDPSWIFLSPKGFRMGMASRLGKRSFDLIASAIILAVAWPFMLLIAVASIIESRGRAPVLFHQVRVGQHGNLFRVHKFRSMRVDAEADGVARWAAKNDSRVTRLGSFMRKTRLDELPQLINVLKGEMSMVGPRPERPEFVQRLAATIPYYAERHRVKPGITGWAQLLYQYGSDDEDAQRKLEYDLYYVKHAGLLLDLAILLQTVEVVVFGKGAR